jgi:hypothetical protein
MTESQDSRNDPVMSEIEALLRVEPSPTFVPQFRRRLEEVAAPIWWRRPAFVVGVAATVAVLVFADLAWLGLDVPQPVRQAPSSAVSVVHPATPEMPVTDDSASNRPLPPVREEVTLRSELAEQLPEVLVPPSEIEAISTLIALAGEDGFRFHRMDNAIPVSSAITEPGDIVVPPITLLPVGGDEG